MAPDDLLDVDAGEMVGKDKGNPVTVVGGKRMGEGGSVGDELDPVEGLSTKVLGNPWMRKKLDISKTPLSKLVSSEHMRRRR
eukprot:g11980.t1